jgi:hypothetical protein
LKQIFQKNLKDSCTGWFYNQLATEVKKKIILICWRLDNMFFNYTFFIQSESVRCKSSIKIKLTLYDTFYMLILSWRFLWFRMVQDLGMLYSPCITSKRYYLKSYNNAVNTGSQSWWYWVDSVDIVFVGCCEWPPLVEWYNLHILRDFAF